MSADFLASPEVVEWIDVIVARAIPHAVAGVELETAIELAIEEQTAFLRRLAKRDSAEQRAAVQYVAAKVYAGVRS